MKITLENTTHELSMMGINLPCTLTLKSTDLGRKFEISPDGEHFVEAEVDIINDAFITLIIEAKLVIVRVTGAVNDTLTVVH